MNKVTGIILISFPISNFYLWLTIRNNFNLAVLKQCASEIYSQVVVALVTDTIDK